MTRPSFFVWIVCMVWRFSFGIRCPSSGLDPHTDNGGNEVQSTTPFSPWLSTANSSQHFGENNRHPKGTSNESFPIVSVRGYASYERERRKERLKSNRGSQRNVYTFILYSFFCFVFTPERRKRLSPRVFFPWPPIKSGVYSTHTHTHTHSHTHAHTCWTSTVQGTTSTHLQSVDECWWWMTGRLFVCLWTVELW